MSKTESETTTAAANAIPEGREDSLCNLPPEVEEGNVEYKLKLLDPSPYRLEHLITQMKWRLKEGQGEAIYKIGVEDNGTCAGLTIDELNATLSTLRKMADRLGAALTILRKREVSGEDEESKQVAELLVRRVPDDHQFLDIRMSVLGNADSGKSTLLGVLAHGQLDNGQGRSRLNLFRHLHEVQSGRTSSISHEIMGFDSKGNVVNFSENRSAEEICSQSAKILTFIDLAGHNKYLKTTIFGLTSNEPDFAILVVGCERGITATTREHLGYALALGVPTVAVITKIDLCSEEKVGERCEQLKQLFTSVSCARVPFHVRSEDDAYTAAQGMQEAGGKVIPFFTTSSVTGRNIPLLTAFLNVLSPRKNSSEQEQLMQLPVKFQIDELFRVPEVGVVVGGTLSHGAISHNENLLIGPFVDGRYRKVRVTTIQRNRTPCRIARAGQAASLSLEGVDKDDIRKGMVLVSEDSDEKPVCCVSFTAVIFLLYHPAPHLSEGFQTTVHVGNVRQTAIVERIHTDSKRVGVNEQAAATLRFVCHPEHLDVGSTFLFRERTTKGMGQITSLHPYPHPAPGCYDDADDAQLLPQGKRKARRSRTVSNPAPTASPAQQPDSPKRQHLER